MQLLGVTFDVVGVCRTQRGSPMGRRRLLSTPAGLKALQLQVLVLDPMFLTGT